MNLCGPGGQEEMQREVRELRAALIAVRDWDVSNALKRRGKLFALPQPLRKQIADALGDKSCAEQVIEVIGEGD